MRMKLALSALLVSLAVACGGPLKYQPTSTEKAPGAKANIVADVKKEQNSTQLNIEIEFLAPPGMVKEGTTTYVVWQRKDVKSTWSRVGSLNYNADNRKGSLQGVSVPETKFELQISAEEVDDPAAPSGAVVLEQKVNYEKK